MSERVCVTGATGFIASHLVHLLLDRGYTVVGTVRDASDENKVGHLTSHAPAEGGKLELVEADLSVQGSFDAAVTGCSTVFHTASPIFFFGVTDAEKELVEPAIQGTLNVLKSCTASPSVQRVICTATLLNVQFPASFAPSNGTEFTEEDWSDVANPVLGMMPYIRGKTLAERAAWDYVKENNCTFTLDTVLPSMVVGPVLQPTVNASTGFMKMFVDGSTNDITDQVQNLVDVRDVATAHLAVLEKGESGGQRYICVGVQLTGKELCDRLVALKMGLTVPTKEPEAPKPVVPCSMAKLKAMGFEITDFDQTLRDTITCYREKGIIS